MWDKLDILNVIFQLETEWTSQLLNPTHDHTRDNLLDDVQQFYNSRRRHLIIGYEVPEEF